MHDISDPGIITPGVPIPPARLHCLCPDCSSSMQVSDYPPSRLAAAIDASVAYVERLRRSDPDAWVGIVGYDDRAFVLSDLAPAVDYPPADISRTEWSRLANVQGGGCTAIGRALDLVADWLKVGAGDAQVVLLTDGHNNTGANPSDVAQQLREHASVTAVGIGGDRCDVDEDLLKSIVSTDTAGRPRYRWIGERDALVAHYEALAGYLTRA